MIHCELNSRASSSKKVERRKLNQLMAVRLNFRRLRFKNRKKNPGEINRPDFLKSGGRQPFTSCAAASP
jgi:hypothetical protein